MDWINDYIREIKKHIDKHIYIYGAGRVAKTLRQLCNDHGIIIEAFCVTNKRENPDVVDGLAVYQIDDMHDYKALFLVGVQELGEKRLARFIREKTAQPVICTPSRIMEYDSYEAAKKMRPAMEITPLVGCTVNCRFCPQTQFLSRYFTNNINRKRSLSLKGFKKCLFKLPQHTLLEFAGFVEPFLNPEAIDMMEYASSQGYEMTLFTTLVGVDDNILERVLRIPFKMVILHTADEKNYANIPISHEYLKILGKILEAKKENGMPFVDGANCQSSPHPAILPLTEGKLKIYCELTDRAGNVANIGDNLAVSPWHSGKICCRRTVNLDHNVLLPDGTVVLCCNDFGMEHILGNLFTDKYADIINGEKLRQIKECLIDESKGSVLCRKCVYAMRIED